MMTCCIAELESWLRRFSNLFQGANIYKKNHFQSFSQQKKNEDYRDIFWYAILGVPFET